MLRSTVRSGALCALVVVAALPAAAQEISLAPAAPMAPGVVLSPEASAVLEAALGGTMAEDLDLTARTYFFPSLQGGTLAMIGFRTSKEGVMFGADPFADAAAEAAGAMPTEVANMELFGAVLQNGAEITRIGAGFQLAKTGGDETTSGTYSFGDTFQPGTYELVWGVRDSVSGKAATRLESFEVPNLLTRLGTSSVLMVVGPPSIAPGSFLANTVYDGIMVLTILVPDNVTHVFPKDTPQIELMYIVTGAQPDPATHAFNIELNYRILDETGASIVRMPPQTMSRPTVGQPIPLSQVQGLEVGKMYKFEITVKDKVTDQEAKTEVAFEIS